LYFSIVLRFPQLRHAPSMMRLLLGGRETSAGISSFQAFALAVSGRVGTGNIAGVATAIALGGPGAVFWMWLIAFLGAGSAFVEATLAQVYKQSVDGQYRGGPAHYIEHGLRSKAFALVFALATILATGLLLPSIQSNSIAGAAREAFGLPSWAVGLALATLIGLIIFGGVKRISHTAQVVVPFMALGYVSIALVVIVVNLGELPAVLGLIFRSAFGLDATFGGIVGMAISWGVKRGIYSNEAGQGTAPMAAAAAEVRHPAQQGLVQAFSVYFDTWFVCSATAFMILLTGSYNVAGPAAGSFLVENLPGVEDGPAYTQAAVDSLLPGIGSGFVAVALFFFAFTTLMAYYYYAETNLTYLVHSPGRRRLASFLLRCGFLGIVFAGTIYSSSLAWDMGDIGVGLMAWCNLIAILLLTRPAVRCLRDYERQVKAGGELHFDPAALGIEGTSEWRVPPPAAPDRRD
jgi:alanine or glycine:cation symporter, AGCS family